MRTLFGSGFGLVALVCWIAAGLLDLVVLWQWGGLLAVIVGTIIAPISAPIVPLAAALMWGWYLPLVVTVVAIAASVAASQLASRHS